MNDLFIQAWRSFGNVLAEFLPVSPTFSIDTSDIAVYLGWLNWLVPVGSMIDTLGILLGLIGTYYVASSLLRFMRVIH